MSTLELQVAEYHQALGLLLGNSSMSGNTNIHLVNKTLLLSDAEKIKDGL